jgi:hypothetical protein
MTEPMIKLEPGGTVPILSYNVPEPTSYSGRHYIALELEPNWFTLTAFGSTPPELFLMTDDPTAGGDGGDGQDLPSGAGGPGADPIQLALEIVTPQEGAEVTGPSTGVTVEVTGTAKVVSGTGSIESVEVKVGENPYTPATPIAPGDFSGWSATSLVTTSGLQTIIARAHHDAGGLELQRSRTIRTVVTPAQPQPDTAPPTLAITNPTEGEAVALTAGSATQVDVTGTASDADSGVDRVEVSVDTLPAAVNPKAAGDWSTWSATVPIEGSGAHIVAARAFDKAGNESRSTVTFSATTRPPAKPLVERILLVEQLRLSSYLGAYGAGRTIKTFSLLPGERTKISIKTYQRTEKDARQASSVLDSFTTTSADDFQKSVEREQASKTGMQESFQYKVGAEAQASWGFGSAKISGEVSGGSNASREELAKNISNATQKHAASASTKRDVQINTSFEVKEQSGEETAIERTIENINVSRTLNFVFRQMNQEFITLLHLVDVRIGYFRLDRVLGQPKQVPTYQEATLSQLDGLLESVIVSQHRQEVRDAILHQLQNIFDYNDRHHNFVETTALKDASGKEVPNSGYLRIKKDETSTYTDQATETTINVPGIILAATKNVLRTDGVIVEALLGQGEALDGYSRGLQATAVRAKELAIKKDEVALKAIANKDETAAKVYAQIYPAPTAESLALVTARPEVSGDGQPPTP